MQETLKGFLRNQKWFFHGVAVKTPFGIFIFLKSLSKSKLIVFWFTIKKWLIRVKHLRTVVCSHTGCNVCFLFIKKNLLKGVICAVNSEVVLPCRRINRKKLHFLVWLCEIQLLIVGTKRNWFGVCLVTLYDLNSLSHNFVTDAKKKKK